MTMKVWITIRTGAMAMQMDVKMHMHLSLVICDVKLAHAPHAKQVGSTTAMAMTMRMEVHMANGGDGCGDVDTDRGYDCRCGCDSLGANFETVAIHLGAVVISIVTCALGSPETVMLKCPLVVSAIS